MQPTTTSGTLLSPICNRRRTMGWYLIAMCILACLSQSKIDNEKATVSSPWSHSKTSALQRATPCKSTVLVASLAMVAFSFSSWRASLSKTGPGDSCFTEHWLDLGYRGFHAKQPLPIRSVRCVMETKQKRTRSRHRGKPGKEEEMVAKGPWTKKCNGRRCLLLPHLAPTLHYTDTHTEAVRSDGDRQGFVAKQSNVKDDIIWGWRSLQTTAQSIFF